MVEVNSAHCRRIEIPGQARNDIASVKSGMTDQQESPESTHFMLFTASLSRGVSLSSSCAGFHAV